MERHSCKLCFRDFANGRALGGHMRSHIMMSFLSPKDAPNQEHERETDFSHSYSSSSEEQEQSTETESSMEASRKSKRVRKSRVFYSGDTLIATMKPSTAAETEPLSSVSDTTTADEDVAYCLMMLSRDKWSKQEDGQDSEVVIRRNNKIRGKYRCESCGRLFRSYQALGGHRASHKKIRVSEAAPPPRAAVPVVVERVHECPFCDRVFSSGQALGGHKRSHFINGAANINNSNLNNPFSRIGGSLDIDLNHPAPID